MLISGKNFNKDCLSRPGYWMDILPRNGRFMAARTKFSCGEQGWHSTKRTFLQCWSESSSPTTVTQRAIVSYQCYPEAIQAWCCNILVVLVFAPRFSARYSVLFPKFKRDRPPFEGELSCYDFLPMYCDLFSFIIYVKASGIPSGIKLTQTIWHHHMWRYECPVWRYHFREHFTFVLLTTL